MFPLLAYLTIVFLGGALLAPCLYWGTQWAAGHWAALSHLAASPFHRFLDRSLLGLALLCLWPLLRGGGMRSWRELGFGRREGMAGQVLRGFALGWVSLAVVAAAALVCGQRAFVAGHSASEIIRHLLEAAWVACVVAVLEELVFRGALFGLLRQSMPWPGALVISSAVYAAVHFIHSGQTGAPVRWNSGLELLWRMVSDPPPMMPAFLTLFAAGSILALVYQRTGALYFSMGLHAGWIFWLKFYRFLLRPSGAGQTFWGTDNLIDGWMACLTLFLVLILIAARMGEWLYTRPKSG